MEKAITKGKRSMLVAMATGTGKTFVRSLNLSPVQSKAARRILLLVDRRALAAKQYGNSHRSIHQGEISSTKNMCVL
ncbi:MAG: DEAD/DEAH box helicase family protein [Desulfomonilia bacterium]